MKALGLFLFLIVALPSSGQDTLRIEPHQVKKELGLLIGYSKEIGAQDGGPIHLAELGLARGSFGGRHLFASAVQATVQLGVHGNTPVVAPRMGAWVGMLLAFGAEVAYYTDFDQGALVVSPGIGYIGYPVNISLEPNIYVTGGDFRPAGGGTLSLTFRVLALKRKTS